MARKFIPRKCIRCTIDYLAKDYRQKYCSQSCAAIINNSRFPKRTKEFLSETYNWPEIQAYYDVGNSTRACSLQFNVSRKTLTDATKHGFFKLKSKQTDWSPFLIRDCPVARQRASIKAWLIREGLLIEQCAICKCPPIWREEKLILVLDHINGINDDCRLENLRLLCPNCNSQTDTFSGRNLRNPNHKKRVSIQYTS